MQNTNWTLRLCFFVVVLRFLGWHITGSGIQGTVQPYSESWSCFSYKWLLYINHSANHNSIANLLISAIIKRPIRGFFAWISGIWLKVTHVISEELDLSRQLIPKESKASILGMYWVSDMKLKKTMIWWNLISIHLFLPGQDDEHRHRCSLEFQLPHNQ